MVAGTYTSCVTFLRRAAACSSIPICLLACFVSTTTRAFQQTTQAQYQFQQWKKLAPYLAFTWRYDSGLVSGAVPDFDTALTFPADQQAQIGLFCGNTFATPSHEQLLLAATRIEEHYECVFLPMERPMMTTTHLA